jgi:cyclopropane fatty-acyl-phospholipid synthase-like methyltransferase
MDMADRRKQIVASGYDRLAPDYLEWSQGIEADPRGRMLAAFAVALRDGARVLDLGCGAGIPSTRQMARRFRVVGVDISAAQIALARNRVPGADFIQGDFTELEFPDASFDGVTAFYAISHVPRDQHPQLFADVFAWLVPGGLFLATLGASDTPDWTGQWLGAEMFFSSHDAEENRRLVRAAGFELLRDEVLVTREPEGDVVFLWVLARKPDAADAARGLSPPRPRR